MIYSLGTKCTMTKEFKFNLALLKLAKTISNSLHAQLSWRKILSDDFSVKIFDDDVLQCASDAISICWRDVCESPYFSAFGDFLPFSAILYIKNWLKENSLLQN